MSWSDDWETCLQEAVKQYERKEKGDATLVYVAASDGEVFCIDAKAMTNYKEQYNNVHCIGFNQEAYQAILWSRRFVLGVHVFATLFHIIAKQYQGGKLIWLFNKTVAEVRDNLVASSMEWVKSIIMTLFPRQLTRFLSIEGNCITMQPICVQWLKEKIQN